jgi:serine/threonine-protein kinase RsbT
MGVGSLRKVRFVTAVSEIVRNAVDHGGGGEIHIYALERPRRIAVRCVDSGPGIADIEAAMADGFSTARSMGKGLGGARRLVDQFTIAPRPEGGIIVEMLASV